MASVGSLRTPNGRSRPVAIAAVWALVTLVVVTVGSSGTGAQPAGLEPPFGLSAPVWVSPELPAEVQLAALWVLPGPDGIASAVDVRFAGPFTPPQGRWRVSVGVGDPAGAWQRVSMVWDGSASSGVAEQIEGLTVADLGPVTATVDAGGSVVVGVPAGVLDATGGGLVWAEAVLGEDTDPDLLVRTPWFPRGVLSGDGARGLVQGSTLGLPAPPDPGAASATSAPAVLDTGVPSVLEFRSGVLRVDRGSAPDTLDGQEVSAAVDLVGMVAGPGTADGPPSGPQVRIDLLEGSATLGIGSVLGPLGPDVAAPEPLPASGDWLRQPAAATPGSSEPLEIDVPGAFIARGQPDPGANLAVSVTRVVTTAGGTVVVAPGVLASQTWLQPDGVASTGAPVGVVSTVGAGEGVPVVPIVAGGILGVLAVGAAMVVADRRHRLRHPGPSDAWGPPLDAPLPAQRLGFPTPDPSPQAPPAAPAPGPPTVSDPSPPLPTGGGVTVDEPVPAPPPAVPSEADRTVEATPIDEPDPVTGGGRGPEGAEAVEALDDDIEALEARLRRLRGEG